MLVRIFPILILLFYLFVGSAGAAEVQLLQIGVPEGGPWTLKADTIIYHTATQTYEASGRVEIKQDDRRLTADYVKIHVPTKIAELQGKAVLVLGEDILTGESGHFNLVTRCGELTDARIFLKRNHFRIDSALIRKTGDDTFVAEKSVVTTCDADVPAWSFYCRELSVKVDGYAVSKGTTLRLHNLPVAYLPAAVLPVKTSRQTGFLMPWYSQHQQAGTVVELPFYWAINNHMDATFYQMMAQRRGYQQGVEYRYAWDKDSGGTGRFSYISDHKTSAPTPRRYWGVFMLNQNLPGEWRARGVLDIPSDSQYLYDYNFGYQGLDRLSRFLGDDYGRNLEQFDVDTRVSALIVQRPFSVGSFNLATNYYRPLAPAVPRTRHKLPAMQATTLLIPLGRDLPFYFLVNTAYTHYYQNTGVTGQRLDLQPRLGLQTRLLDFLEVSGEGGWRGTGYRVQRTQMGEELHTNEGRSLPHARASVSIPLYRDWGRHGNSTEFVRHFFTPKVTYTHIGNFDVNRIPKFDPFDYGWQTRVTKNYPIFEGMEPIGGVNAVTYSLNNHFVRRSTTPAGQPAIREVFWSRLTQSVFFNSSSYGLDAVPQPHHRFSDIFVETIGYPLEQLGLGINGGVSPYHEGFSRIDVRLVLRDQASRNFLNIDYIYFKNYANQINSELFLDIFRSIKIGINNQHTFLEGKRLENKYRLIFTRQCWGVAITVGDRVSDRYVSLSLIIPGIVEKQQVVQPREAALY